MKTIKASNVNEALYIGTLLLSDIDQIVSPRGARTIEYPEPVATVYQRPWERVLFSSVRDANPFFHLFESLWILAGRDDVNFLTQYNRRMAEFSDNGSTFHAPYGYRIKPQIPLLLSLFDKDPDTRRGVLQIWDWGMDLDQNSRDIPCNDLIFFKIRGGRLHMTVCNRSNDMIWGAYGANAVQFSVIQEYLAACLGVEIGRYTQVSDSFHVYLDGPGGDKWKELTDNISSLCVNADPYDTENFSIIPLAANPTDLSRFDSDLSHWFSSYDRGHDPYTVGPYHSGFFHGVVIPMAVAWDLRKHEKNPDGALHVLYDAPDPHCDWIVAGIEWMERRQ